MTAEPQDLQFPDEDFRHVQPPSGAPHPFKLPGVQTFALPSGIRVYLVEQHALPIVSMDLNFDGGSITDPPGKAGLANVCMAMLTEGTAQLDKLQYSEALADIASQVNAYAADDFEGVGLATLTKHFDATFALFADTLRAPGLRASDFERMIKRRIEALRQLRGNPTQIPSRVMGPVFYGPAHPLGSVVTEQSLAAITLDDCRRHLATWLRPAGARLFVVGDLTRAQIEAAFGSAPLADWSGGAPPASPAEAIALPAPEPMAGSIFFVDVPGAAQSTVMFLAPGPTRSAPDYFANMLVAAVFGGSFTSRLNMNLREDKGYAYSARGGFTYSKAFGAFTATAAVQAESTYQTVLEIAKELGALASATAPVTAEELDREKLSATLALPGRFATSQAALGQYRSLVYYGLPLDYFDSYTEHVDRVTAAQLARSASAHLSAPGVYLVVGDGSTKMVVDDPSQPRDRRRTPYLERGSQLTLREALVALAGRGDVGPGGLVELDVDGRTAEDPSANRGDHEGAC